SDERDGGDAGAAVIVGSGPGVVAEIVSFASVTEEFLDRWRLPEERSSHVWEERFGEQVVVPLAQQATGEACRAAGITPS
ncbi:MAG TPA: hydroxymethylglutaryl-CoA synthase, partial [Ilumatobacteraceae bacterium]|nr:hydroxymethylglutaryl-CoA synthase [Ilumatobacteraceae bacterium]